MINILSISASPIVGSSTDFILRKLTESILLELDNDVHVDFVRLNDLNFTPCQACGKSPEPDWCSTKDGLTSVLKLLAECDCLLFGTPIYFDSVSAQGKMFIDRCNCFRPPDYQKTGSDQQFVKRLTRQRPGAMVLVGGEKDGIEGARCVIAGFFKWVEVINEGKITYQSRDYRNIGSASGDNKIQSEIVELGRNMASCIIEEKSIPQRKDK